jgi:hypothetical protein
MKDGFFYERYIFYQMHDTSTAGGILCAGYLIKFTVPCL